MKTVKLKKSWLSDPEKLLRAVGAVNDKLSRAFPSEVYLSKEDYKVLTQNTAKAFKKKYPFIHKRKLESSIAIHMLNLGPNESLGSAVRPGVALVDEAAIEEETKFEEEMRKEQEEAKKKGK